MLNIEDKSIFKLFSHVCSNAFSVNGKIYIDKQSIRRSVVLNWWVVTQNVSQVCSDSGRAQR